jgi:hypothetical protein
MRAGAGDGSALRSKWSSEEDNNKLESRRREMQEIKSGGRILPRGNRPLLLGKRHPNLLPLHLFTRFRLRPDTMLFAGTCAEGNSLVKRCSIYYFIVRDS